MFVTSKPAIVTCAFLSVASSLVSTGASAVTVEVAKKCDLLVAKAFPPREPGNPAAGSAKGTAQDQRSYFSKCVANGGNMDGGADKDTK
ncbi:hypothetical protein [Bradyrhizobium canariense]|uniref:PsiF repeat-containing protein n=1 Tax=Bradyrhizobium canariense TaxID=255045 RepID=A0A1H1PJD3_9BRAD|nr:hypothetical protein [Bradyrhizobium canariense]SDS11348.1 hypothetical protein SAMN05444158_1046 [Bradyrhizobium canariense]